MSQLVLGDMVFEAFEVPDRLPFGGSQTLAKHKLPGGSRIIDAMGPDDGDIEWSGRFRGPLAMERARHVDYLRRAGGELPLSWGDLLYLVVIEDFKPSVEVLGVEVPYTIKLCVIEDLSNPITDPVCDPTDAMNADLIELSAELNAAATKQAMVLQAAQAAAEKAKQASGVSTLTQVMQGVSEALSTAQAAYNVYKQVKSGNLNMTTLGGSASVALGSLGGLTQMAALSGLARSLTSLQSTARGGFAAASMAVGGSQMFSQVKGFGQGAAAVQSLLEGSANCTQMSDLMTMGASIGRMSTNTATQQQGGGA